MEGEYSDLSAEERLNALVALIAVANEGISVRIVLESFNCLLASLDVRGNMEANLHAMLQRIEARFKEAINKIGANISGVGSMDSNSPSTSLSISNTKSEGGGSRQGGVPIGNTAAIVMTPTYQHDFLANSARGCRSRHVLYGGPCILLCYQNILLCFVTRIYFTFICTLHFALFDFPANIATHLSIYLYTTISLSSSVHYI